MEKHIKHCDAVIGANVNANVNAAIESVLVPISANANAIELTKDFSCVHTGKSESALDEVN